VTAVFGTAPNLFSGRSPAFRPRCRFLQMLLILAAGCVCSAADAKPQQNKPEEYQVKAVYLYNFGRFVEWPLTAVKNDLFKICVLGNDPFGPILDTTLAGEVIENRKLVAMRIASTRDAAGCKVLFISSSEAAHLKEILKTVDKAAVLTVSDMPGFTNGGGMIQFVLQENKVRFEVNLTAAERSGLTLSSQLLKVATEIKKAPRSDDTNHD
jgi:hypothetical protein